MSNMIQAQIMHDHGIPVTVQQLIRNMSRHIVVNFGEVLRTEINILLHLYTAVGRV
jgi:hypothetical protein